MILTAEQFDNFPFEEIYRYELDEGEFIVTEGNAVLESPLLPGFALPLEELYA